MASVSAFTVQEFADSDQALADLAEAAAEFKFDSRPCRLASWLVAPNYATGHNVPGYLPESDPWITSDWESARDSLITDLDELAECLSETDETGAEVELGAADEAIAALKQLAPGCEFLAHVGERAFWLTATNETPEDSE